MRNRLISQWGNSFNLSVLKEKVTDFTKAFMNETVHDITKLVSETLINSLFDQCLDLLIEITATKEFYFYLVDEYTMEPLTGCEDYPVPITVKSETFKTLVPLAQVEIVFIFFGLIL